MAKLCFADTRASRLGRRNCHESKKARADGGALAQTRSASICGVIYTSQPNKAARFILDWQTRTHSACFLHDVTFHGWQGRGVERIIRAGAKW